jgi:hypothetical protein
VAVPLILGFLLVVVPAGYSIVPISVPTG